MTEPAKEQPAESSNPVAVPALFSVLAGLASSALGAGWPGVIALAALGLFAGIGGSALIRQWN